MLRVAIYDISSYNWEYLEIGFQKQVINHSWYMDCNYLYWYHVHSQQLISESICHK